MLFINFVHLLFWVMLLSRELSKVLSSLANWRKVVRLAWMESTVSVTPFRDWWVASARDRDRRIPSAKSVERYDF